MQSILLKIFLVAGLLAGSFYGGYIHGGASERAAQEAANDARREDVAITNKAQAARHQEADRAEETRRAHEVAGNAAARDELGRLRQLAANRNLPGPAVDPGVAAYAATVEGLLADCAGRYSGVAAEAGDSAGRLGGLQDLVRPQPVKDHP